MLKSKLKKNSFSFLHTGISTQIMCAKFCENDTNTVGGVANWKSLIAST